MRAPCRVVYVIDEPRRFRLRYAARSFATTFIFRRINGREDINLGPTDAIW
jgi:hypothetical protein